MTLFEVTIWSTIGLVIVSMDLWMYEKINNTTEGWLQSWQRDLRKLIS